MRKYNVAVVGATGQATTSTFVKTCSKSRRISVRGACALRDAIHSAPSGAAISLTLYWQAAAATERPLTVFVHLVNEAGEIRGYGDSEPGYGRLPTTSWLAGEYLTDPHQVSVDAAAAPGSYRLRIGLYDRATGQRLLTPDGRDHAEIGPVLVGPP